MANIWEKAISILAGNLNLGCSYLITTVTSIHSWYIPRTGTIKELRMQIFIFIQKMKLDIAFFFLQHVFFLPLFALDAKPKNDTLLVEIDISFKQATSSAPCRCRLTCVTYLRRAASHCTTFWEEITCF